MRLYPYHLHKVTPQAVGGSSYHANHPTLFKPSFPRWYDANAYYDYYVESSGHSIENCSSFKHKVQKLVKLGILKFESLDQLDGVKNPLPNPSKIKMELIIQ